jgi:hypothetical protein
MKLFHGTSRTNLTRILRTGEARNLYLAEDEYKSWDYAERAAYLGDNIAMLILDENKLDPAGLRVDPGSTSLEWEHDMGQYIYTGPITKEAVVRAFYVDDMDREVDWVWGRE